MQPLSLGAAHGLRADANDRPARSGVPDRESRPTAGVRTPAQDHLGHNLRDLWGNLVNTATRTTEPNTITDMPVCPRSLLTRPE